MVTRVAERVDDSLKLEVVVAAVEGWVWGIHCVQSMSSVRFHS